MCKQGSKQGFTKLKPCRCTWALVVSIGAAASFAHDPSTDGASYEINFPSLTLWKAFLCRSPPKCWCTHKPCPASAKGACFNRSRCTLLACESANASSHDAAAIAPTQASLAPTPNQDASDEPGTDAHLSPAMRTKQLQRTMEARKKASQTSKSVANEKALAGTSKPVATPARAPARQNPMVEAPSNPKVVGGDQDMDAAIAQCVREDIIAAMDEEHDEDATVWGGDYESRSGASLSLGSQDEQDLEGCDLQDAGSEASENEESGDEEGKPTGGRSASAADQKLGREAVDAELGRPAAWGQGYADYVTKEDQEPCKPRGRKPKKGKKGPAKKGKGRKSKAEEEESEEMEEPAPVESKKRKSKAPSATASKKARKDAAEDRPARVRAKAKAFPKTRPTAKGKAKAKAKSAAKAGPKTKAKNNNAGPLYRSPCLDDASYKAKQSRKSSAYHRAMKEAREEGLDEDLCKLRAREVAT